MQNNSGDTFERVLAGRPRVRRLYRRVRRFIASLGDVEVILRKTQVGFRRVRMFAWIWLPQIWIRKQPADSVTLSFALDHRLRDKRIKQSAEPYRGRFTHHVVIADVGELDASVRGWLHEAHLLADKRRGMVADRG
jgi:hypothetical protein